MWKNKDAQEEVLIAFDEEWMENTHHHFSQIPSLKQEGDFFPSLPRDHNPCTSATRYLLQCSTRLKCCQTPHVCFMREQTCRGSPQAQGSNLGSPHLCEEPHGMQGSTVPESPAPDRRVLCIPSKQNISGVRFPHCHIAFTLLVKADLVRETIDVFHSVFSYIASRGHLAGWCCSTFIGKQLSPPGSVLLQPIIPGRRSKPLSSCCSRDVHHPVLLWGFWGAHGLACQPAHYWMASLCQVVLSALSSSKTHLTQWHLQPN